MLSHAIEIENEYLKLLGDREAKQNFDFIGKLSAVGYTLEQYHKEKELLIIDAVTCRFGTTSAETIHDDVSRVISKNDAAILVCRPDKTMWYVGSEDNFPNDKLPARFIGHGCDNLLVTDKDLSLAIVTREQGILNLWQSWLDNELDGMNARTIGAEKRINDFSVYFFHIYGIDRTAVIDKWLQ